MRDLNDSKQLTERQRENFFAILTAHSEIRFAIAIVDAETIDRINILQATHRAMNDALAQLQPQPEHVLVDGRPVKSMSLPNTALVKGDARSYSIAAASVLAKVTRDRMMLEFDEQFPATVLPSTRVTARRNISPPLPNAGRVRFIAAALRRSSRRRQNCPPKTCSSAT